VDLQTKLTLQWRGDVMRARLRAWGEATRRGMAIPWVRETLALFLAVRVGFILVTYVGYVLVQAPKYTNVTVGVGNLLLSWDRWDALRYLAIAAHGYPSAPDTAFFPLYPLLIASVTAPFGGQGVYAAGLLVSNLAFVGALLVLHRLTAVRWGPGVASRAVLYLTVFPTALYTFAPYNESLFLLFSLGCFLALDGRRWALAGALGALAVLTRAAGILLLIPFVYVWWQSGSAHPRYAATAREGCEESGAMMSDPAGESQDEQDVASPGKRASLWDIGWALLLPGALGLYAVYCAARFGDPLAFAHAQGHWNRILAWPWQSLWWQLVGLAQAAPASFYQAHDLLDLAATLGFAAVLVAGWRRLPRAQTLYFAALLLLVVVEPGGVATHLHDPLTSNGRFVLEMFPGFIALALLTERRPLWHQAVTVVSSLLLATLSIVFVLGRWLV
jgi:hypothetical protein